VVWHPIIGTGTVTHNNNFNLMAVRSALIAAFVVVTFGAWAASPCSGVDHSLTTKRSVALAPEIAKQLHVPIVDVLQSFRFGGWSIIYVNTHQSDEVFLFYAHDPLRDHYVTLWSGAARIDEGQWIKEWVGKMPMGFLQDSPAASHGT